MNKETLKQLKNELQGADNNFRRTELYKILKEELSRLGYWKNKERGNSKKGYRNSEIFQMNATIRIKH